MTRNLRSLFFIVLCLCLTPSIHAEQEPWLVLDVELTIEAPFSKASIFVAHWPNSDPEPFVAYNAQSFDGNGGPVEEKRNISVKEFQALSDLIEAKNFRSFESEYVDETVMDATTYHVSVKMLPPWCQEPDQRAMCDAAYYTVRCSGSCPQELLEIIKAIKDVWGKEVLEVGI